MAKKKSLWGATFIVEPILTSELTIPSGNAFDTLSLEDRLALQGLVIDCLKLPLHEERVGRYKIAFAVAKQGWSQDDETLKDRLVEYVPYFSERRIRSSDLMDDDNLPRYNRKSELVIESLKNGKDSRKNLPLYINSRAIGKFVRAVKAYVKERRDRNDAIQEWNENKSEWIKNVVNWRIAVDLGDLLPRDKEAMSKQRILDTARQSRAKKTSVRQKR